MAFLKVGADIPLANNDDKLAALLDFVKKKNLELFLCSKRSRDDTFNVQNYIEKNGLQKQVHFFPYYDVCRNFPYLKLDLDYWFEPDGDYWPLSSALPKKRKRALFATMFHPGQLEGNSQAIRFWLDNLHKHDFKTDILYYKYDETNPIFRLPPEAASFQCENLIEIPVESRLVGKNENSLNVHVDDWCGVEAIEKTQELVNKKSYDLCFVNYSFFSAIFEKCHSYTKKILCPHDSFVDRNRKMIADGYPQSGWMSITAEGEKLAMTRTDSITIFQSEEYESYQKIVPEKVQLFKIPPLPPSRTCQYLQDENIVIGYMGSANWVNETNLAEFLLNFCKLKKEYPEIKILIAGGVCNRLKQFCAPGVFEAASPHLLGCVKDSKELFSQCSLVINPDRGGTGIKIKNLEAFSHGIPLLCTKAASIGIPTKSPFHSAKDTAEMVNLLKKIIEKPGLLANLAQLSKSLYKQLEQNNKILINNLLG